MPKELAVPHNEINSYHDDIADDSQAFTEFLEIPTDQPITSPKTESKVEAISQLAKGAKVDIVKPLTAKESKQTEFIFMGEMYVQMPKSKYLEEKKEYEERISAYKTLLKDLGSKIQDAFKEPQ